MGNENEETKVPNESAESEAVAENAEAGASESSEVAEGAEESASDEA